MNSGQLIWEGLKLAVEDPSRFAKRLKRYLRPMRAEYRRRFRMNLGQWLIYHQEEIVFEKCSWMGVRANKNPFDTWIYQEIIYEVKPDVIIELGSAEGGSTLYFAHLLDLLGKGTVVSVDKNRSKYSVEHERIRTVTGDTSSLETIEKVSEICAGRSTLVIHDADHRMCNVLNDLEVYSQFVSPGSYLIVEDGIVDLFRPGNALGNFEDGPLQATEEFLQRNSHFAVDKERERYLLTYNPKGFLKRLR